MRPKGIIGLLVVILIVVALAYVFSDAFIEGQIESFGESIVGAKVEVDDLDFSLIGLSISLDRLQVANPNDTWKNMIETGRVAFDMEVAPLARKKVIINDITMTDFRIGTQRETDGAIPKKPKSDKPGWVDKARESLMQQVAEAPVLNLGMLKRKINVDSLMATFDVQSVDKIQRVRGTADSTFKYWESTISDFKPKHDFQKIEHQIAEIKPKEVKSVEQLVSTFEKTRNLVETVNGIKNDFQTLKNNSTSGLSQITDSVAKFDDWVNEDFNRIKSKANIGEFSAQNVGKMLFGRAISLPTIDLLEYMGSARKYMPVAQQFMAAGKVEKPPRLEGQDIAFPLKDGKPDFLIEKIDISAATNQQDTSQALRFAGKITGITSQPHVYGKPLNFDLDALLPGAKAFGIRGELDHTGDIPKDRFQVNADGIRIGNIDLPKQPHLPTSIVASRGDFNANFAFIGDELDFKLQLDATPVQFQFPEGTSNSDVISKVTHSVFGSIERLNLSVGVTGKVDALKLKIGSNIDNILAQRIQDVIGESATAARQEIRKRLNAEVEPKKQEALAFIGNKKSEVTSKIDQLQSEIDAKLGLIEEKQKEIQKRIAEKKKEGLEDVSDKLKDLFKKNEL